MEMFVTSDRLFEREWPSLLNHLLQVEAYREFVYDDALPRKPINLRLLFKGNATIGVGFNIAAGCSRSLAYHILKFHCFEVWNALKSWPETSALMDPANLSSNRRLVLISMGINQGVYGLSKWQETFALLRQHDYSTAADHIIGSLAARQAPHRYELLEELMRRG